MSTQIPEEIKNQWCEEFENLYLGKWTEFDVCKRAAREAFTAAKTSSYEREILQENSFNGVLKVSLDRLAEIQKLQERILSLEKWEGMYDVCSKRESEHIKIINHILEQSRVRGYPTAQEWNALVNQVKKAVR